jgi:hypothetical protein
MTADLMETINNSNLRDPKSLSKIQFNTLEIILLAFKIMLILATIVLNFFIVYIIVFLIKKRNYTNFLFLSSSLADLLIAFTSQPFMTIYSIYGRWPHGNYLCIYWMITDYSSYSISILSLLLVSIQRYNQTKSPLVNEDLTTRRVLSIIFIWIISYLFWISMAVPLINKDNKEYECDYMYDISIILLAEFFTLILPIMLISIMNLMIYVSLKRNLKRRVKYKALVQKSIPRKSLTHKILMQQEECAVHNGKNSKTVTSSNENDEHDLDINIYRHVDIDIIDDAKNTQLIETKEFLKKPDSISSSPNTLILNNQQIEQSIASNKLILLNSQKKISIVSRTRLNKENKAFLCLFIVTSTLIISWALFLVLWPMKAYCNTCVDEKIFEISIWLIYSSSCSNAVILLIFHEYFKKEFCKILASFFDRMKPAYFKEINTNQKKSDIKSSFNHEDKSAL